MECYSIIKDGHDMITAAVQKVIESGKSPGKQSEYEDKLRLKIVQIIKNYESRGFQIDGLTVKNLEGPFFEFRAQAGGTDILVRIFFFHYNINSVVLTGAILKPKSYEDKKATEEASQNYINELKYADIVKSDFLGSQRYTYQYLKL